MSKLTKHEILRVHDEPLYIEHQTKGSWWDHADGVITMWEANDLYLSGTDTWLDCNEYGTIWNAYRKGYKNMNKFNKNELYIALPEGKLHVYVTETTPDTKDGLIYLDDDYLKSVHVDLIDKDGKVYKLSKTEYQFTRTDHLDDSGNMIWMERIWVTGKDIEPPIDIADLKELTPEEEAAESKRVSSQEYIEMVKNYFTSKK